jgi:hypothetical protein
MCQILFSVGRLNLSDFRGDREGADDSLKRGVSAPVPARWYLPIFWHDGLETEWNRR